MKQSHKLDNIQKIEIINKYTCSSLGREYKISHNTVRYILINNNIELKNMSQARTIYSLDEHYFDIINTEEKAYFLGLLYADGYNNEKNNLICLSLQEEDKEILEKLSNNILSDRPLGFINNTNKKNRKNMFSLRLKSNRLSTQLSKLGCPQKKSFILEFPTEEQVPSHLIRHFIRGYFDGDGCISLYTLKNKYNYITCCSNICSTLNICSKIQLLLNRESINSYISQSKKSKEKNTTTRTLSIGGKIQTIKFLDWLYKCANIYLERKYQKYQECKKLSIRKCKELVN